MAQVHRTITLNKPDCTYTLYCGNEARYMVDGEPCCGKHTNEAAYVHPEDEDAQ